MENAVSVYKCPCCDAGLAFGADNQNLVCEYCGSEFDLDTVKAYNDAITKTVQDVLSWDADEKREWSNSEEEHLRVFSCPTCGGEILTDENTAATFCPFCSNPSILPARVSGGLKPDAILPFQKTKEDAKSAFLKLCQGKPLLPKFFTKEQQLEKITGIYVPFWLYDCSGDFDGNYKATRITHWSDANYNYTKTDHFLLSRGARADFTGIPMDGSSKMDDTFMESIEPFDYSQLVPFDTAYLSGYFADKYDVPSDQGESRIQQRVSKSMDDMLHSSFLGYSTVIPTGRNLKINNSKAKYVLLPVWMLNTMYNGKNYTFAMNGQTGKMTGALPICKRQSVLWFTGIFAAVTALVTAVQLLLA